jgi:hypothetical protein
MKRAYIGLFSFGVALAGGVSACDDDDAIGSGPDASDETPDASSDAGNDAAQEADPKCVELGARCHPFDHGEGLGHECHEIGHENAVSECHEKYDECIAFCTAPDAGAPPDASIPSACEEIGHKCHELDDGGDTLAHECHEVGHAGDLAACEAIYPQCIALCDPAGAGDAGKLLCDEIGEKCHPFDDGGAGLGHECHEVGHTGDVAACAAIYDQCITFCSADAGHDH